MNTLLAEYPHVLLNLSSIRNNLSCVILRLQYSLCEYHKSDCRAISSPFKVIINRVTGNLFSHTYQFKMFLKKFSMK